MSKILLGVCGAIAVSLMFGAVQLASGHDLSLRQATAAAPETVVNRAAKADRAVVPRVTVKTETVGLRLDSLGATSVLIRMPAAQDEARNRIAPPQGGKSERRRIIACEPVVSILTEIAKNLQPGRCIT